MIGMFRGKEIDTMTREELLEVIQFLKEENCRQNMAPIDYAQMAKQALQGQGQQS